jgi:hypothetical protein
MPYAWPYDYSRASLYRPGEARDFFSHGTPPSEAALAAELTRLAYCRDRTVVDQALTTVGLMFVDGQLDRDGTQWLLARGPAASFLAFRGTEVDDPSDLPTDLAFLPIVWGAGGSVHRGFAAALDQVWPRVSAALDAMQGGRFVYTGHSLGGALAVLAASRRGPARVYTVGCPRVGDAEFADGQSGVDHVRFVHCCDLVTRVPPFSEHTGQQLYLDREGNIRRDIDEETITADRQAAFLDYLLKHAWRPGTVAIRELTDHTPVNYVSAIWGTDEIDL